MQKYLYQNKHIVAAIVLLLIIIISIFIFNINQKENTAIKIPEETEEIINDDLTENYYIDLKGAVNSPGVYKFEEKVTINTAIENAGGFTKNAYTDNINLSHKISDGMVIYIYEKDTVNSIPVLNEEIYIEESINSKISIIENNSIENVPENNLVNINYADINLLMTLSGIGEVKANAIISYRQSIGQFMHIEEIQNVNGIGSSTYESIKDSITI